jgi:hypothetical protein
MSPHTSIPISLKASSEKPYSNKNIPHLNKGSKGLAVKLANESVKS